MNSAKICRFCLSSDADTINLFDTPAKDMNCIEIISQHFWFTPSYNDTFSSLMCTDCWTKVENFHSFYLSVKSIETKLLQSIENSENDVKNDEFSLNLDEIKFVPNNNDNIKMEFNDSMHNDDDGDFDEHNSEQSWTNDEFKPIKRRNLLKRKVKLKKQLKRIKNKDVSIGTKKAKVSMKKKNILENVNDDDEVLIETKKEKKLSTKKKKVLENISEINDDDDDDDDEDIKDKQTAEQYEKDDERIREFFILKCDKCDDNQLYQNLREIRTHFRSKHSTSRGYLICCKRKFFRRSVLLEHLSWHLNPELFQCQVCKKLYTSKSGIKSHMPTHATDAEKIFCCDICGKRYAKKFALSHHLRLTHIPEEMKKHKCKQCDKAFAARSLLDYHIRGVHEFAYQNICEICAKVFKSKHQCEQHRRLEHSNEKNRPTFQCTHCGASLKTEFGLARHIRCMHVEKPVSCHICSKVTPNKGALRSHIRYMHEIEKTFHCKLCEKSFKRDKALKEHMASHTGGILYNCPYCTKTFNSNANMHSHRKKIHPIEWLRDRRSKTNLPTEQN